MIRILLFLAVLALVNSAAEHMLNSNLAGLEQAYREGTCEAGALSARQSEPIVRGIHFAQRNVSLALALITACLCVSREGWIRELLVTLWTIGFVSLIGSSGFALAIEFIADGMEIQWGFHPAFLGSIEASALLEGLGIIGSIAMICYGPPRGWNGSEDFSWV